MISSHLQILLRYSISLAAIGTMLSIKTEAATYTVTSAGNNPSDSTTLAYALTQLQSSTDNSNTININSGLTIYLNGSGAGTMVAAPFPVINSNVIINGNNSTVDGNSSYQAFSIIGGTVEINDLTIQHTIAQGGTGGSGYSNYGGGGGGGLGAGGAISVLGNSILLLSSTTFSSNTAQGGNGGFPDSNSTQYGAGGNASLRGVSNASGGTPSGSGNQNGNPGGSAGGGGSGANGTISQGGSPATAYGGDGGFGGGGGGGTQLAGGTGGASLGGNGGGGSVSGAGGGGAGLGGAIYVQNEGNLTLTDGISFDSQYSGSIYTPSNNVVGGGKPYYSSGIPAYNPSGLAVGPDLFLSSGGSLTIDINSSSLTLYSIGSDQGLGGGTGGGLSKTGTQTLILNMYTINSELQPNTYTGITTLLKGSIQAATTNAFSPNTPVQLATNVESVTLDLNNYNNTIPGVLDYIPSGSPIPSSSLAEITLGSGALTLAVPSSTSYTFSGVISETGKLVMDGASAYSAGASTNSTQTLNGDNTYTGPTTITQGILVLNGTNSTSSITIDNGGCLSGSSTYPSADITVNSGGTNNIGNSSGTIHLITGDYTLNSGSTLSITKDPNGTSLGIIGGSAYINNAALYLIITPGIDLIEIPSFTFLDVEENVSGSGFSSVTSNLFFMTGTITLNDGNFTVHPEFRDLASLVDGNNAKAVGTALNKIISSNNHSFSLVTESFFHVNSPEALAGALNQMQPAQLKTQTIVQENNAIKVQDAISYRIQNELTRTHCIPKSKAHRQETCPKEKKPFHVWTNGFGDILRQNSLFAMGSPQVGYQSKTGGVVTGIEGNFSKIFTTGVLGAYTGSTTKWASSQGKGTIDTGYGGLYLSALGDLFYGNASVIGGWSHLSTHRNIIYPEVTETATNSHGASQILSHLDTGLNFGWQGVTIRPFDSFDYVSGSEEGFTESGAGALDLNVNSSNSIILRNELGLTFAGCFCVGTSKWSVSPKFSWVREVRIKGSHYTAEFVNTDIKFEVTGYFPDRSLFSPGLQLSGMMWDDFLSIDLYYDGEFGQKVNDQSFGGQIRFGF